MARRAVIDDDDLFVDIDMAPIKTTSPTVKKKGRPSKTTAPPPPVELLDVDEVEQEEAVVVLSPGPAPMVPVSLAGLMDVRKMFDFRGSKLTPMQQLYVMAFATRGTRAEACQLAECTYRQAEEWMNDPEFRGTLEHAVSIVADRLEGELMRRAMDGSDRLLLRAIEAARPEKYARVIKGDLSVVHSWADLAKQVADDTEETEETTYEVGGDSVVGSED